MSSRRERRANDPEIQKRREMHLAASNGAAGSGGWGVNNKKSTPATGQQPIVNPFMTPKAAGLNITSQTYPSNYYVEWNLSTWRYACDQAIKFGYTVSYATLVSWVFECSPFIQSLFRALSSPVGKIPFLFVDKNGNELPEWTEELCNKSWHRQLRKEIAMAHFWGFTGLNIDPINGKVYKYPMQDIDPINRMLRASTYGFYDGVLFGDNDNLLFVQPSTSYESFLGWMQPIARSFIQMNLVKNNWVSAGRKLAFPMMTVGYPQNDGGIDGTETPVNQYKIEAENVVANADPSKGLVYPYTIGPKGEIIKSLDIEYEKPGTAANTHKIFSDFNDAEKNEIREFILGGTLTSSVGDSGSRALGDVHQEKLENVINDLIEFVLTYFNDEYLKKIRKFYKNFPEDGRFAVNVSKEMSFEDIKAISTVLNQNGKRLTDEFFESNGLVREFFEDIPLSAGGNIQQNDDTEELTATIATKATLASKKKF